jgi:hypothetical protein
LADLTSLVPSYVVSKICYASLADSLFEILMSSDGEVLDKEYGGLYHWKIVHFSQGLVRELHPLA